MAEDFFDRMNAAADRAVAMAEKERADADAARVEAHVKAWKKGERLDRDTWAALDFVRKLRLIDSRQVVIDGAGRPVLAVDVLDETKGRPRKTVAATVEED